MSISPVMQTEMSITSGVNMRSHHKECRLHAADRERSVLRTLTSMGFGVAVRKARSCKTDTVLKDAGSSAYAIRLEALPSRSGVRQRGVLRRSLRIKPAGLPDGALQLGIFHRGGPGPLQPEIGQPWWKPGRARLTR